MTAGDVTGSHILSIATEKFSLEAAAREMLQKYKKKIYVDVGSHEDSES